MTTHLKDIIAQMQDPASRDQMAEILAGQMPPPDDAGSVPGAAAPISDPFGGNILPTEQGMAVAEANYAPPPPQLLGKGIVRAGADTTRLRQEYQRYVIETQMNSGVFLPWEDWLRSRGVPLPNTGGG